MSDYIFTSESVSSGHPDKICDQISDTILDAYLKLDPNARVAAETVVTTNRVILLGEISSHVSLSDQDYEDLIRKKIKSIGYEDEGFHWKTVEIQNYLHTQSADISQGIGDEGAGDQGIMFGYACRDTDELMPAPLHYAHKIMQCLEDFRKKTPNCGLKPDAKSQVSFLYKNNKPYQIEDIVVSTQHSDTLSLDDITSIVKHVIAQAIPEHFLTPHTRFLINPTGRFVIGGPVGDSGLTGRKIIVDTYGGKSHHGGGAFSGKDPSKVDRSAAYMARYLAKNIVAANIADECVIQLSYAIGHNDVISIFVNTKGTGKIPDDEIASSIMDNFDLSPKGIRSQLNLNRPIYAATSTYGHFGRSSKNGHFTWEKLDLVSKIQNLFSIKAA